MLLDRDETQHPVDQEILEIRAPDQGGHERWYTVGSSGITRIEAAVKGGLHCNLPYVRVWANDHCIGEFCQHGLMGVFFKEKAAAEPKPTGPCGHGDWDVVCDAPGCKGGLPF